ncbi:acyl-CoA dehydrogenase family protein [Desulfotignum balticum]|uniref:acyl-CoA dehydrogenase family protein n=1 Tax=Desulfotignum balticum TaxID=115781 RepID=UPI00338D8EA9
MLNPLLPAEYGGVNLPYLMFSLILSEVGKVCASSAVLLIAQADGMLPILHSGSTELKKKIPPAPERRVNASHCPCCHRTKCGIRSPQHGNHGCSKWRPIYHKRSEMLYQQRVFS